MTSSKHAFLGSPLFSSCLHPVLFSTLFETWFNILDGIYLLQLSNRLHQLASLRLLSGWQVAFRVILADVSIVCTWFKS